MAVGSPSQLAADFSERAERIWTDYQRSADLASLHGMVAGVDPDGGRVWIADDVVQVVERMHADGVDTPLWFVRVGYDYLNVKGSR